MRTLLLLLLMTGALLAQDSNHGPYANVPGATCWRRETIAEQKQYHCDCKMMCENNGMEDRSCLTFCGSNQCICHADETCDAPDVEPAKPR